MKEVTCLWPEPSFAPNLFPNFLYVKLNPTYLEYAASL